MIDTPEIGSVWVNNKLGTHYTVYLIAYDFIGTVYIIYQETYKTFLMGNVYYVKHSEKPKILGFISLEDYPNNKPYWYVIFDRVTDNPEKYDLWGRPLDLWFKKFTQL